ncbi:hypothetical protein J1N35_022634 [Gossypium stocksii]|uniref:Uncharacterized protein n=1 Tax=Gossypium stocksii TaxID=47602 RepID=A0A9D3VH14_9ROSI|nr:hypothetical protein J1N35_022634 [Gossypium stocksii]
MPPPLLPIHSSPKTSSTKSPKCRNPLANYLAKQPSHNSRSIMPRKRTHASAQIDETQNKFHYEEAKVRYESIFKNQQMHLEKGFTLKESNYKDFMARIRQVTEALNWELFCEKKPSVDEELVREFYPNLTSNEEGAKRFMQRQ